MLLKGAVISIDFDDFTSPFTPSFLFRLRRYIKHSIQCFIGYPNTSNFVKNTPLRVVFSTFFSVFGYPDETLSLVFDILRENACISIDKNSVVFVESFLSRSFLPQSSLFPEKSRGHL